MKIRQGFVSNSSSTSFCIYGVRLTDNDLVKDDDLWRKAQMVGLESHLDYDGSAVYLGRAFKNISDNETGADFKATAKSRIENLIGREVTCSTHDECWG
jgi:hypothetical protein